MKLLGKFNLILLVIFGVDGFVICQLSYSFLIRNARREVMDQAELMAASTQAVRDYTDQDLKPLLEQNPRHRVRFLAETVPFYAATTTFHKLRKSYPDFSYKGRPSTLPTPKTERRIGRPISSTSSAIIPAKKVRPANGIHPQGRRFSWLVRLKSKPDAWNAIV